MNEEIFNTEEVSDDSGSSIEETPVVSDSVPSLIPDSKPQRRVSLATAVASMITAVVIAVMSTFALTASYMKRDQAPIVQSEEPSSEVFDHLALIDYIFRELAVTEFDEDFEEMILKAYVAATGDLYAEYFTDEELEALTNDQNGEMCGIGIAVVNGTCTISGVDYATIVVSNVYKGTPAERAGVLPGDYVMYVGVGEDRAFVPEVGYTKAIELMTGEEGTTCSFSVFRLTGNDVYEEIEISAVREKIIKQSVYGRVYSLDETVGVIKISEFDNTTAKQFRDAVEDLQSKGCTSFVLDLRGNPGGLLTSVQDMLTFFLEEGDTMISVKDNKGNEKSTKLTVSSSGKVLVGSKTLTKKDVGRYRNLNFSVLVNGYSASAAELFTANMRDYELATIVGTTTFGKGSMQTTIPLGIYGCEGALKLTTAYYYPPSGVGYHGVGVNPDAGYAVELNDEAKKININLLTDEQDNQLATAVKALAQNP